MNLPQSYRDSLRPLTHADLDAWHELQTRHIADPYTRDALHDELGLRQARTLGAFEGGRLLGSILAWLVVDELQIMQVVVAPEARRLGVGRALVEQVVRRARAAGAVTATLEVRASNTAAIGLYDAIGFEVDGRRARYYPDGEDAVLMHCDLAAAR